ncbi:hypothetical protein BH24DEI2_BH24DEI2_12970 [soil metagenome]
MRIAVVGAGSSGLVTLKYLLDAYPAAAVTCFEKGHSVRGCWGDQRADFVSTSTKYTTQFSCFRQWQPEVAPEPDFTEFYRGGEFGDYLDAFADHFDLRKCIRFGVALQRLERVTNGWRLHLAENGADATQVFDAVFLCTGLVNKKIPVASAVPIAEHLEAIRNKTVVVVGGGESATDIANHLAKPDYGNTVFLSLRSGVRVSPRYHPIRGVPSDFLRNRLLMSFSKNLRNWVGERFVTFRIRFDRFLAGVFPHRNHPSNPDRQAQALRREWDLKLKARAKGELFNVFHNKSDDFLEAVAERRLTLIGPPTDNQWNEYFDFDHTATRRVAPDVLVPSTGYQSGLADLSSGAVHLKDFYHGCVHVDKDNLFLIGFARPIIGNIPSISEMQARYAVGVLAGNYKLPENVQAKHEDARRALRREYPSLDTDNVYPVEQFPYCDVLAREMGVMPSRARLPFTVWMKIMLAPASTTHYLDDYFDGQMLERQKVYTPTALVILMVLVRSLSLLRPGRA